MFNNLPVDILVEVLTLVVSNDRRDFISLCTASRACYEAGKHILYSQTRCDWKHLERLIETFSNENISKEWSENITFFQLSDSDCWHEWRSTRMLEAFLRICPRLCRLRLHLSGTSKWLKYLSGAAGIVDLCLVSDRFQPPCLASPAQARLGVPRKGDTSVRLSMFDVQDLVGFPDLQTLELHHCFLTANTDMASDSSGEYSPNILGKLKSLVIFNCHWHYPLSLDMFSALSTLIVVYIERPSQIISERQLELAKSPPKSLKAIAFAYKVDGKNVDHWIGMLSAQLKCRPKLFVSSVNDSRRLSLTNSASATILQEHPFEGQIFTSYPFSGQTSSLSAEIEKPRSGDELLDLNGRTNYSSLVAKVSSISNRSLPRLNGLPYLTEAIMVGLDRCPDVGYVIGNLASNLRFVTFGIFGGWNNVLLFHEQITKRLKLA